MNIGLFLCNLIIAGNFQSSTINEEILSLTYIKPKSNIIYEVSTAVSFSEILKQAEKQNATKFPLTDILNIKEIDMGTLDILAIASFNENKVSLKTLLDNTTNKDTSWQDIKSTSEIKELNKNFKKIKKQISKLSKEEESALLKKALVASKKKSGISQEKIDEIVVKVSLALDLDDNLIRAIIMSESNYNNNAVSPAGARGLMQVMPTTAAHLGIKDPHDPLDNIWGGARYIKYLLNKYNGNRNSALAAYNWGPGNFDKFGKTGTLPKETRNYIIKVNSHYTKYSKKYQ